MVENPIGVPAGDAVADLIEALALPFLPTALLASVVSAVRRFRRARGVERAQLKWFAYGAVSTLVLMLGLDALPDAPVIEVAQLAAFWIVPTTAGLAILRYRLYDIDHVVSRTVTYGLLTATLAGVYAVGVVGLGASCSVPPTGA